MGLLDDAIREHLELKRRHGADPTEVARQESEALGPARRSSEPSEDEPPAERLIAEPEPELEYEPDPELVVEPERVPEFDPDPEPEPAARRIDPDLVDQPTMEHSSARPEPPVENEVFDVDAHSTPEAGGPPPPPAPADEDPGEAESDVLEGTPEFLEETPEHDRLWFEQRPPRDFDFDD